MEIPIQVKDIIKTLEDAGFEAFIVGGCVRDYLLGKTPKDWDITTSALPNETKKLFSHTYDTGIQHGTITVVIDKNNYEVTTYRIDGSYSDFRHPTEVIFTKKIDEDLSRRDFTMNAVAYSESVGFCDPFFGREDIKRKIIRGVGDPDKRFNEDALRMLRGLRFSAQLNFEIEEETFNSIKKNSELIKNISVERIREEFTKLLLSQNPEKIVELNETGLLKGFLPVICDKVYEGGKIVNTLKALSKNGAESISLFCCALFFEFDEKECLSLMKALKFDTKTVRETAILVKYFKTEIPVLPYEIRKTLYEVGEDIISKLFEFKEAFYFDNREELVKIDIAKKELAGILKRGDCFSLKKLEINGNDLKNMADLSGKQIGEVLMMCLEEVLKNPLLNRKEELEKIVFEFLGGSYGEKRKIQS